MGSPADLRFGASEQETRAIDYLSRPGPVRMAQDWFAIAPIDHFWVQRRFAVAQKLAEPLIASAAQIAEIGCGHGLLQRQIEDAYGKQVWGCDLNEHALRQNISRRSKVCCYDVFQRNASLRATFDLILLFDVLEHLPDEPAFLDAILFHLAPEGKLIINVPAGQSLFSAYDVVNGHFRRYSIASFRRTMEGNHLELKSWTYWGLPLVPALFLRKYWLMHKTDEREITSAGFDSRSPVLNRGMNEFAKLEWIPQHFFGTSLMAICARSEQPSA